MSLYDLLDKHNILVELYHDACDSLFRAIENNREAKSELDVHNAKMALINAHETLVIATANYEKSIAELDEFLD